MYYFIPREIPIDIVEMGKQIVKAFNVRERFFHLEFFRTKTDGQLIPFAMKLMVTDLPQSEATRKMLSGLPVNLFCPGHSPAVERHGH